MTLFKSYSSSQLNSHICLKWVRCSSKIPSSDDSLLLVVLIQQRPDQEPIPLQLVKWVPFPVIREKLTSESPDENCYMLPVPGERGWMFRINKMYSYWTDGVLSAILCFFNWIMQSLCFVIRLSICLPGGPFQRPKVPWLQAKAISYKFIVFSPVLWNLTASLKVWDYCLWILSLN